jgi:hypothetical protein
LSAALTRRHEALPSARPSPTSPLTLHVWILRVERSMLTILVTVRPLSPTSWIEMKPPAQPAVKMTSSWKYEAAFRCSFGFFLSSIVSAGS